MHVWFYVEHLCAKYEILQCYPFWLYRVYDYFTIWLRWPKITFDLHEKQVFRTQCHTSTSWLWDPSRLKTTGYRVFEIFTFWPLSPHMIFDRHKKNMVLLLNIWHPHARFVSPINVSILRWRVHKPFTIKVFVFSSLVTSDELWSPPKKSLFFLIRKMYVLRTISIHHSSWNVMLTSYQFRPLVTPNEL